MSAILRGFAALAVAGPVLTAPAAAQRTHVVRLIADASAHDYRFAPAALTVRPNDVIVFRVASGAPHSIVFEREGLSPDARGAFDAAMPGRSAELSSPLLTEVGAEYRMVVPRVPAGTYHFYCLPHKAYDERGSLTVR